MKGQYKGRRRNICWAREGGGTEGARERNISPLQTEGGREGGSGGGKEAGAGKRMILLWGFLSFTRLIFFVFTFSLSLFLFVPCFALPLTVHLLYLV